MTSALALQKSEPESELPLRVRREAGITELLLNRPSKANALSAPLVEMLIEAVAQANDDDTRLLVLRGEGSNFCAGFDFSQLDQTSDSELVHRFVRIELLLQALHHAPFATLALCHGGTYGAGADIVCACDRRVAAPGTIFRMPGWRFGIALGTRRLAYRIGADRAREVLGSSRTFSADEAKQWDFIDSTAEPEAWDDIARDAFRAVRLDRDHFSRMKNLLQPDTRAADLAALSESASVPGLKDRIKAFRATRE